MESSTVRRFSARATSASNSRLTSASSPSATLVGHDAQEVADELVAAGGELVEDGGLPCRIDLRVPEKRGERRHLVDRLRERREVGRHGLHATRFLRRLVERAGVHALCDCHPLVGALQRGEVELGDRLVDEASLVFRIEDLARDTRGGLERQLCNLSADELERPLRLGVDLALRLLQTALSFDLGLVLHAGDLRIADLARLGQDLRGLVLRLRDQRPVLLDELAGFACARDPPPRRPS